MTEDVPGDVHVALLRGINVGGRNRLPMKRLRRIFADAGAEEVGTYIQSGSVVFRAGPEVLSGLAEGVSAAIADSPGLQVPVVLRSAPELREVVDTNPFLEEDPDPKTLHVAFLRDLPGKAQAGALDDDRSPPDRFELRGRDIYLHCPDGIGRSKLTTRYFDSTLDTVTTLRNWRTVNKLLELAEGLEGR